MITNEVSDGLAGILRTAIVELVRRDGPDLSARQLGVFLTCYLETEAQTVRGLAAKFGVSKPAITRALDRLSEFDLVRRKTDPLDRRSVLVQRTATGMAFLREMRTILRDAASTLRITAEPAQARARTETNRPEPPTKVRAAQFAARPPRLLAFGPERYVRADQQGCGGCVITRPASGTRPRTWRQDLPCTQNYPSDRVCCRAKSILSPTLANAAAVIYHGLPSLNWAGFYLVRGAELVLGPFQGKPACIRIPIGKGVCGTAALRRNSVLVPDVHGFPAISPATRPPAPNSSCR